MSDSDTKPNKRLYSKEYMKHKTQKAKERLYNHKSDRQKILDKYKDTSYYKMCAATATNGFRITGLSDHEFMMIMEFLIENMTI